MKRETAIILISIALILLLGFGWCNERKSHLGDTAKMQSSWVNDTVRLTKKIKADSSVMFEMESKLGSNADALILANDKAKGFSDLLAVYKAKISVEVKDKDIPVVKQPEITHLKASPNCDSIVNAVYAQMENCIPVGSELALNEKWFSINLTLDTNKAHLNRLVIPPGDLTLVIGDKGGFLSRKKHVNQVTFQNPYISLSEGNNIVVKQKKPKRLLWLLTGLAAGFVGGLFAK